MTSTAFKIGDTVRLKSGGPLMTITGLAEDRRDIVYVSWFDSAGKPAQGSYPPSALQSDDGMPVIA